MGSWSKSFIDRKILVATDEEVAAGKASWSKSRLDGMCGAALSHDNKHIAISGAGEYWQSDDLEVDVGVDGPARFMVRRIMKRIDLAERLLQVLRTENSIMLRIIDARFGAGEILVAETIEMIPVDKVGQWLVLELDVVTRKFRYYYSPERI